MLKPKSLKEDGESLSVTVLNTLQLPSYSTERFYMLSEIELRAHSTLFLCDYDCDQTEETVESTGSDHSLHSEPKFPPFCVLYILWKPQMVSSAKAFAEGMIQDYVQKIKSSSSTTKIYLLVEILVPEGHMDDDPAKRRRYHAQVDLAQTLARRVARTVELRTFIEGITIGVANHVRAAPGLDVAMEAVSIGSKTRRRYNNNSRSIIGVISYHPDDLLGLADSETDAAQDVLQSITCAEWSGYGDLKSFANRAHAQWCDENGVHDSTPVKRRVSRRYREALESSGIMDDPIASFVIIVAIAWVYFYGWTYCQNKANWILQKLWDILLRRS